MKNIEEAISRFRQKGYKITPQRRAIFKILVNNDTHPNAEAIYQEMKNIMPDISITTVYSTLKELNETGAIDAVHNVGGDSSRYDPNTENHHHLYCQHCHRIIDLEIDFKDVKLSKKTSLGFKIIKKQITFFGYCSDCQKRLSRKTINT